MMMPTAAQAATAPYIVVLKPGADVTKAVSKAKGAGATVSQTYKFALRGYAANIPTDKVSAIAADPSVGFVAADSAVSGNFKPPKTCTSLRECQIVTPDVLRIDADEGSARSGDGTGDVNVDVAVLDSGVAPHKDLNLVGGKGCLGKSFYDQAGHGTHVAGTIGAKTTTTAPSVLRRAPASGASRCSTSSATARRAASSVELIGLPRPVPMPIQATTSRSST
jgi:subtilisin